MNISKETSRYIREHPSIADCLERGLINYSALAREICAERGIEAFDAVLMGCRRYRARQRRQSGQEAAIRELVSRAKLRVANKILVATLAKDGVLQRALSLQESIRRKRGAFNLIEGEEAITIITNTEYLAEVKKTFGPKVKKLRGNLVQISMLFDEKIESTPGVVSFIYRIFAEHGINVREEMSCWTDVMVIIDEADAAKAIQLMSVF